MLITVNTVTTIVGHTHKILQFVLFYVFHGDPIPSLPSIEVLTKAAKAPNHCKAAARVF